MVAVVRATSEKCRSSWNFVLVFYLIVFLCFVRGQGSESKVGELPKWPLS